MTFSRSEASASYTFNLLEAICKNLACLHDKPASIQQENIA
ncbi:MAG: hypothetical protein AB1513_01115 [Pseudomonadota bacterium]